MIGSLAAALALVGPASLSRRDYVSYATSIGLASSSSLPALADAPTKAGPFSAQPGLKLNTGVNFPSASFGLQVYDDDTAYKLTRVALDVGYRNFSHRFSRAIKRALREQSRTVACLVRSYSSAAQSYRTVPRATTRPSSYQSAATSRIWRHSPPAAWTT